MGEDSQLCTALAWKVLRLFHSQATGLSLRPRLTNRQGGLEVRAAKGRLMRTAICTTSLTRGYNCVAHGQVQPTPVSYQKEKRRGRISYQRSEIRKFHVKYVKKEIGLCCPSESWKIGPCWD